jgi:hypothetical protein
MVETGIARKLVGVPSICLVTVAVELLSTCQNEFPTQVTFEAYVPWAWVIDDMVDIEPYRRISMSDDITARTYISAWDMG